MASYRAFYIGGRGASWKDKLKLALLGLAGGAVVVAAVILSIGLALVVIPLGFLAYLFRRPLLRALLGRMNAGAPPPPQPGPSPTEPRARPRDVIIDADYTVIDTSRRDGH